LLVPVLAGAQTDQRYIVEYRRGASQNVRAASVQRAGAELRHNFGVVDAAAVTVRNPNALAALERDPDVLSIIPDRPIFAIQGPNAEVVEKGKPGGGGGGGGTSSEVIPDGVKRIGPPSIGDTGLEIGVAIVDTGIDFGHTDLAPAAAYFSSFGGSCQDNNGHGTHVTGIVAALMGNGKDVVGVAPGAKPYCVKVLDASGSGSDSDVMAGLNWVSENADKVIPNIRVVNMSLGRPGSVDDNIPMHDIVTKLYMAGIVVVVAAGNDATLEATQQIPSAYHQVLAVASTTAKDGVSSCKRAPSIIRMDTASYFTSDGFYTGDSGVTISAPGETEEDVSTGCFISSVGILSTKLGGGTTRMSGTSMAAPHVAGAVARIRKVKGLSGVAAIRDYIRISPGSPLAGTVPLDSPTTSYSYDGQREGIITAP
jgi:subtilisin family serine protease